MHDVLPNGKALMKFGVAGCRDRENLGLVRSVDLLDGHMSPGGLCRPSDNFGAILATPERATANGKDFVLALAVAYEFQGRFTVAAPVMATVFNHALHRAMSVALEA